MHAVDRIDEDLHRAALAQCARVGFRFRAASPSPDIIDDFAAYRVAANGINALDLDAVSAQRVWQHERDSHDARVDDSARTHVPGLQLVSIRAPRDERKDERCNTDRSRDKSENSHLNAERSRTQYALNPLAFRNGISSPHFDCNKTAS